MHKMKPCRCPVCRAEVPDEPMPVLKHRLSPVKRRPYATGRSATGSKAGRTSGRSTRA